MRGEEEEEEEMNRVNDCVVGELKHIFWRLKGKYYYFMFHVRQQPLYKYKQRKII